MPLMPVLFLKAALGGIGRFLSGLTFWQIMCGAALIFAGVQTLRAKSEQRHAFKVEQQLSKCVELRKRLEEESKAQQREVGKTVERYITVEKPVIRKQIERIESAPLPGECTTPQPVLEADV